MNEIVFLLFQKQPTALKYLLIKHQNIQKHFEWIEMHQRQSHLNHLMMLHVHKERTDALLLFGKFSANDIPNKFSISSKLTQTENYRQEQKGIVDKCSDLTFT